MDDQIAVIGMACRVPGAPDLNTFWRNLIGGMSARTVLSRDHLLRAGVPAEQIDDPDFVPVGYLLDDVENFDAGLFGLTPREAALADPQHRLFLELCHAALENAGWDPACFDGDIGVYGGRGMETYRWRHIYGNQAVAAVSDHTTVGNGNHADTLTTLASYVLNLRGPSVGVYTACSTSLVAVHLAAEALRAGECDMALAGGVSIELPADRGYLHREGAADSSDGYCRPFDAQATGTVAGSGGGVVLLKRLSDAIADGDHIRAVVLGNAINNDGSSKVGFTASGVAGEAAVIANALATAGVEARSIGYVEASATGSALGDPIEVEALTSVYGRGSADRQWCALGSVKSNLGHLSQGAGVVGLIKTVLSLQTGLIPASLGFTKPNPAIVFEASPFYVNTTPSVWKGLRRAAVSSFGIGGTNAHVILEEAPAKTEPTASSQLSLIAVSARSAAARDAATARLAGHLEAAGDVDLADVAHTLRVGRVDYPHRMAIAAVDVADAIGALRQPKRRIEGTASTPPRVVMLFPGTPQSFTAAYESARQWQAWQVSPSSMIGHGTGEYVAAALAGVFDLSDAQRLVALHERMIQSTPQGSALTVPISAAGVEGASVVAIDGPGTCIVSGAADQLEQMAEALAGKGITARRLRTTYPLRDHITDSMLAEFAEAVAAARPAAPRLSFISSQTGLPITDAQATDPAYWASHLREPVLFGAGVAYALAGGRTLFLECGSGRQLAGLAQMQVPKDGPQPLHSGDLATCYATAGRLWVHGLKVDTGGTGRRVPLPGYPYERTRHWIDPDPPRPTATDPQAWRRLDSAPVPQRPLPIVKVEAGQWLTQHLHGAGFELGESRRWVHAKCLEDPEAGLLSLVQLVQALKSTGSHLDVVTAGTYRVLDSDELRPERAMLAGVIRSARELPGLKIRHIDGETDLRQIVAELSVDPAEAPDTIALRAGQRWTFESEVPERVPAPSTNVDVAERLAPIWSELLGAGIVGPEDDFFALGGNSLTAVQLIAQIRAVFSVRLSMRLVFDNPTLAGMAAAITRLKA